MADQRDLVDTICGGVTKGGREKFISGVHWPTEGNSGTVGGPTTTLGGM